MKWPQFRLVWLMGLILLVGVDFHFIRQDLHPWHSFWWYCRSFSVGVLPMLNILVLGLLIHRTYPASRGFIVGFEIIGMTLVGNYYAMLRGDTWVTDAIRRWGDGYVGWIQQGNWASHRFAFASIVTSAVITLPMVLIASVAGFMSRNFDRDVRHFSMNSVDEFEEEPEAFNRGPATGRQSRSNPF